jgi:hypothetical protein
MSRMVLYAAILAVGLAAMPLPQLTPSAIAQTAAPADAKAKAETKRPQTSGQTAMRERQKKCGAEWKAAKAAGKIIKGMTWPRYWSACNKRLKSGG